MSNIKKNIVIILLLIVCHGLAFVGHKLPAVLRTGYDKTDETGRGPVKNIVIVRPVQNENTDKITEGFKSTCSFYRIKSFDAFTKDKKNIFRPKDNIVPLIMASKPDLILAIGERVLAELEEIDSIPIIYTHVSDKLPGKKNITGMGKTLEPEKHLRVIQKAMNGRKRLGVIYQPDTTGSYIKRAKKAARKTGIRLLAAKVTNPYNSQKNMDRAWEMLKKADAVWIMPDPAIHHYWARMHIPYYCIKERILMFTFSEDMIDGEFMSVSPDNFDIGRQAGELGIRILFFKDKPEDIPKADLEKAKVTINADMAELLKIKTDKKMSLPEGWTLQHKRYKESFRKVRRLW